MRDINSEMSNREQPHHHGEEIIDRHQAGQQALHQVNPGELLVKIGGLVHQMVLKAGSELTLFSILFVTLGGTHPISVQTYILKTRTRTNSCSCTMLEDRL